MQFSITYKRLAQALLIVGPLASLAVSPTSNYDPINLIKLLIISSIAFYCLGLVLSSSRYSFKRLGKFFWYSIMLFVLAMFSTLLFSGAPITQQIWGTFGRNTGFLTYLSLLIILIGTALVQDTNFYEKLINSFVLTAVPMTVYCIIQYAGLDPIGWSEKHPFGTLGNINFSSAFFGLTSICAVALIFERKFSNVVRASLAVLVILDLLIVLSTGSIQGFMIFIAGTGLTIYLYMRSNLVLTKFRIPYIFASILGVAVTVLGLSNTGPLAKFLFAPSIVFRTDYWHAGWSMTKSHPLFGVGLDSYGDWYRTERGLISTVRTGTDRIANTAHNIFLDISSNGGIPLISAYLAINFIAFRSALKVLKRDTKFKPYFVAILSAWFGYLIFSAISINQVGVGIWGWLLTGALIGYEITTRTNEVSNEVKLKKVKSKNAAALSPMAGVLGFTGLISGFILSFIPFNADVKYKAASLSGDFLKVIDTTRMIGSTAFHNELALDTAGKNNFDTQARDLALQLVKNYPLDFMGWRAISLLKNSSQAERDSALKILRDLDPYNPDIPKS